MGRVEGKVAIVTGGASGIGKATCILLAKEGARVALADIQDAAGKKAAAEIKKGNNIAEYFHLDVSNGKGVERAFADIYAKFGKIDVLVNNAGVIGVDKQTHEIDESEWDRVMNINSRGVFLCTKYAIPYMLKGSGGSIINMSSIWGLVGGPMPHYHASKGAVRLKTKTDALAYGRQNIRVNSIHPGAIWTPIVESIANSRPEGAEQFLKDEGNRHMLGHIGEPIDVAYGVLYLASDESKFVTGSELVIDGGYTAQ